MASALVRGAKLARSSDFSKRFFRRLSFVRLRTCRMRDDHAADACEVVPDRHVAKPARRQSAATALALIVSDLEAPASPPSATSVSARARIAR